MSECTSISKELIAAYHATTFRVDSPKQTIHLVIGQISQPLTELHALHDVSQSAFLTAWNPFSQPVSRAANRAAQKALISQIGAMHLSWLPGAGVGKEPDWPPEASILVLGLSLEQTQVLARQFKQNAFVFNNNLATPNLHFCC